MKPGSAAKTVIIATITVSVIAIAYIVLSFLAPQPIVAPSSSSEVAIAYVTEYTGYNEGKTVYSNKKQDKWAELAELLVNTKASYQTSGGYLVEGADHPSYIIQLSNIGTANRLCVMDESHIWADAKVYRLHDNGELYRLCAEIINSKTKAKD